MGNRDSLNIQSTVRGHIALSTIISLAVTACYVAQGTFLAWILGALFAGGATTEIMFSLWGLAAVIALRAGFLWAAELAAQSTAQATKEELRRRLFTHLMELGPGVTQLRQTGDIQATIIGGVEALETYYSRYIPAIVAALLGCGGVLAVLAVVDWRSAGLLILFVIAFPVLDRLWMRWRMPEVSGVFAAMGAFGSFLLDSLQGIVTLKAFGASGRRREMLAERAARLRRESMETLRVTLMRTGLTGFITLAGIALVLSVNSSRVAAGELAPFALLMTLFLAREAFRPLDRLEKEFHTAWAASGAIEPISDLLSLQPWVREISEPASLPREYGITFDTVGFTYPGAEAPALASVSFVVGERETVALVGPSGAGKTTVATLLQRFFDSDAGSIYIGGTSIRYLSLADLRSLISVVSQDIYLFHGTIADNLRLAKPEASDQELRVAAAAAHIDSFIESLPLGYDTAIGERGAQLSGGQRQRLAIARALLKDAPILILDEATSNVDPASEREIQAALDELAGERTTLVITHRLSTVSKADRIFVFEGGRLVEEGDHRSLVAAEGLYARLMAVKGEAA